MSTTSPISFFQTLEDTRVSFVNGQQIKEQITPGQHRVASFSHNHAELQQALKDRTNSDLSLRRQYSFYSKKRTEHDGEMIRTAINNFNESFSELKATDRRTAFFIGLTIASFALSPVLPVAWVWGLSNAGLLFGAYSYGTRQRQFDDYVLARANLKLALRYMVEDVLTAEQKVIMAGDDASAKQDIKRSVLHLVTNDEHVTNALKALMGVMTARELDPLIDDLVEETLKTKVLHDLEYEAAELHSDGAKSWFSDHLAKEQHTMHYMMYGNARGSKLDFAKGIWYSISNLIQRLVNWFNGTKRSPKAELDMPVADRPQTFAKPTDDATEFELRDVTPHR